MGRLWIEVGLTRAIGRLGIVEPVPIPVQAHFEGVLNSFSAAADQIAAGFHAVSGLGEERMGLGAILIELPDDERTLALRETWRSNERRDVSEVRRRASHFHYHKTANRYGYYVDQYREAGIENRELTSYSHDVFELTHEILAKGTEALHALH